MKKEKCKNCKKKTKYMYSFNQGTYCERCKELGLAIQKYHLGMEQTKDRMRMYRRLAQPIVSLFR